MISKVLSRATIGCPQLIQKEQKKIVRQVLPHAFLVFKPVLSQSSHLIRLGLCHLKKKIKTEVETATDC